jgi:hypothetical protein
MIEEEVRTAFSIIHNQLSIINQYIAIGDPNLSALWEDREWNR